MGLPVTLLPLLLLLLLVLMLLLLLMPLLSLSLPPPSPLLLLMVMTHREPRQHWMLCRRHIHGRRDPRLQLAER